MTTLVWFRNDLRTQDHAPLAQALSSGSPVRAVYFICPEQWREHDVAPIRQWYVLQSLLELGERLADLGVGLDVIKLTDYASVPDAMVSYVTQHNIQRVLYSKDYPLNEVNRDRAVENALISKVSTSVEFNGFDTGMMVPPSTIKTLQGGWYTVFTPYKKRWQPHIDETPALVAGNLNEIKSGLDAKADFIGRQVVESELQGLSLDSSLTSQWQPGEQAALSALKTFCKANISKYHSQRDIPSIQGTSLLSAALSAGTIAVARCYALASDALRSGADQGAQIWINELAWRDFYRQVMANFPHVAKGNAFRADTRFVPWRRDEQDFERWCQGQTGFPLVDAAMRQLKQTGWMHNRLRMVSAMFLTKQLLIDWRWGERWFMSQLIDGDFAANNGGWQWSASTGTDAAPYFRIFNPVRQGQRFDPTGDFIRQFVPEIAHLDDKAIHEPWKYPLESQEYISPIVALSEAKEKVQAAFRYSKQLTEEMEMC